MFPPDHINLGVLYELRVSKEDGSLRLAVTDHGGLAVTDGRDCFGRYSPLSLAQQPPAAQLPSDPVLRQLQGLWMGIYGPHGKEVLHVRFVHIESEEAEAAEVRLMGVSWVS